MVESRVRAGVTGFMAVALLQVGMFSSIPVDSRLHAAVAVVQLVSSVLFWSPELDLLQKISRTWWRSVATDVGKTILVLNALRFMAVRVFFRTRSASAARTVVLLAGVALLFMSHNYSRLITPSRHKRAAHALSSALDVDDMVRAVEVLSTAETPAEKI